MPTITEEMDEFVNWDNAEAGASADANADLDLLLSQSLTGGSGDPLNDLDLVLENVDGDDFSFWALQHYENSTLAANGALDANDVAVGLDGTADTVMNSADSPPKAFEESFETFDAPCHHCQQGGYQCKRIREGKYRGYCTSCVALRCECSFGLATATSDCPGENGFPYNPWPLMGDHPEAITQEDITHPQKLHGSTSAPELAALTALAGPENNNMTGGTGAAMPTKIGARFSRESVKILKNWLSTHNRHPYPSDEEKEMLQKQTGLNKTQITNWLANARRRGKIIPPRSTSPGVRSWSNPIDIPQRRGTPASFEHMNPLQRWQNSPPENEPASVTAIARAVTASTSTLSSGLNSPYSLNFTDDGSGRSLCAASSASSFETSHSSGGSFASAYSHQTRGSFGSHSSLNINYRGRRRRRRKAAPPKRASNEHIRGGQMSPPLSAPHKTFQCTFCTETFRTKHDWQRHEKSLHLSLERWVCAPDGPRACNASEGNGAVCCVFCGHPNPDEAHIDSHNYSACQERTLEERTFYRKDHLRQHLKLVHGVKFVNWSMEPWKVATPEIRSRCGFCGIVMDTWTIRVDHLAEHFKTGKTMADWKGDWGFDNPVLEMVENSIPPYLIHDERNTPYPFEATQGSPESARNAYELIKGELMFYIHNEHEDKGRMPTDEQLQLEACRIIFGSEVLSKQMIPSNNTPSWLRDLILCSSEQVAQQARLAPIRSQLDSGQAQLKINGKDNIFEDDPMEVELHEYVKARRLLGLTAMDSELQVEACNIIGRMEESSNHPSDEVANFLLRLIYSSTKWLADFRQRAVLPRSEDLADEAKRSKDPNTIDSTIHNYSRLESELAEYVRNQRSMGIEPSDAALQKQARIIIYEFDDGWNQTAADNIDWLNAFKQRHVSTDPTAAAMAITSPLTISSVTKSNNNNNYLSRSLLPLFLPSTSGNIGSQSGLCSRLGSMSSVGEGSGGGGGSRTTSPSAVKIGVHFLNDANCYRRLARELGRYVASVMSPNNPNCHVPSDEELQHQARWILYDDDDPWNQTAADNAEWLRRFKRDVGILTDPSLPGLPSGNQWNLSQGGSGFAPPYAFPNPHAPAPFTLPTTLTGEEELVDITLRDGAKPFVAESSTANKYLQNFTSRLQPPAQVFCSRELEHGLVDFVSSEINNGRGFPGDGDIKQRARDILGLPNTAADDGVLLEKFKAMMRSRLGLAQEEGAQKGKQQENQMGLTGSMSGGIGGIGGTGGLGADQMDLTFTQSEIADILQDMNFEFGDLGDLSGFDAGGAGGMGDIQF
ncbi:hypothetical protein QBC46DRAFT_341340 [Diplogelasinospora grovesii]|uniref:Uncharacterized protein n=1 Tax=Diplogelasinospora grovesii TaxID=303347 RepID=A0AAN6S508_9PEZI|nr:hypothetical protein QBC46DRAFT_341340 [Diplogelasinospora grovesii]